VGYCSHFFPPLDKDVAKEDKAEGESIASKLPDPPTEEPSKDEAGPSTKKPNPLDEKVKEGINDDWETVEPGESAENGPAESKMG